ncbi:hypothetical protein EHW67_10340 [Arenibacter aquaticus]|uniref:DUF4179 domain-containing protein n=1 Tax=Arenibacter aquaticus TaxID=2489054 RepID=A0A3S0BWR8_9FLAO|nr:hypothetical protein [Arenibacter aquaticus]RTE53413.1 hypothetical protein EHW67_10340 [Arenibacter aquaticus]
MHNDPIENLFKQLEGNFDFEEPKDGHESRFLAKLESRSPTKSYASKSFIWWKSLAVAACLLLFCSIALYFLSAPANINEQLSNISPEAANTEYYFANIIEEQVKKLHNESTPETEKIIADTMLQLETLDKDYKKMQQDLLEGGNSKLILSAMITNFQTRIDLLNEVLEDIEEIKILKNYENENSTI